MNVSVCLFQGADKSKPAPIKIKISATNKWRAVNLNIKVSPDDWHPDYWMRASSADGRRINAYLGECLDKARMVVNECAINGVTDVMAVTEAVRDTLFPERHKVEPKEDTRLLLVAFDKFTARKQGGGLRTYLTTRRHIAAFLGVYNKPRLDDINKAWLEAFDLYLANSASPNARAVYLRCLRAVINYAIDMEWTQTYAFRRFHIKTVPTRHRALEVEDLRRLLTMEVEPTVKPYRDFFFLSFLLIGINSVDLLALPPDAVKRGRIEYRRSKTAKLYDIKVEPEAQLLIDEYLGEVRLWGHADNYDNYKNYNKRVNEHLAMVGEWSIGKRGKKTFRSEFEGVTLYWARHTWATIAASLDIPKETIAQALGHSSNSVTDVYIKFDRRKVDEANRRVIDWVLYGKR